MGTLRINPALGKPKTPWKVATLMAKAPRIKPYLDAVHTLKPSLIEAEELTGIRVKTNKELPDLAAWFHEREGIDDF